MGIDQKNTLENKVTSIQLWLIIKATSLTKM